MSVILGIDIGGTGMKAGLVDTEKGEMISKKVRYLTPKSKMPDDINDVVGQILKDFNWGNNKKVGLGFPSIIEKGICKTAVNIDESWIGTNAISLFEKHKISVSIINDADAAGFAEVSFGAAQGVKDIVLMITLGTGVGSGLFYQSKLIPNIELGTFPFKGKTAEDFVSNRARKEKELSWKSWGGMLDQYLNQLYKCIHPSLIVLGGGVSKKMDRYQEYIDLPINIIPAKFQNSAGIIGAACYRSNQ